MFSLFRKKSELERLTEQYQSLLEASFKLSTTDRKASDLNRAEAEALVPRIDELRNAQG
ncbi:MAG: Lacal_2735 family protein [Schleiferiaceae bacterium]